MLGRLTSFALALALVAWTPLVARRAAPTASALLERSLAYHDPLGHWDRARFRLELSETRPEGRVRSTRLRLDNIHGVFEIRTTRDGAEIGGTLTAGECRLELDGSTEVTAEQRDKFGLTCERLTWLRNYYTYLSGLPMKLRDAGTLIDPEVEDTRFEGADVWAMRVTYDETVGSDTWTFYFDQRTFALVGCRFFHDEAAPDGEYIVFEGEIEVDGLRLPKSRAWYTNAEGRYLGTDTLKAVEVEP